MELRYQGPKKLEKPIRTLYQVTNEHLTRDANLKVILGEIERIGIEQGKLVVTGDNEVNDRIDTAHRKAIQSFTSLSPITTSFPCSILILSISPSITSKFASLIRCSLVA